MSNSTSSIPTGSVPTTSIPTSSQPPPSTSSPTTSSDPPTTTTTTLPPPESSTTTTSTSETTSSTTSIPPSTTTEVTSTTITSTSLTTIESTSTITSNGSTSREVVTITTQDSTVTVTSPTSATSNPASTSAATDLSPNQGGGGGLDNGGKIAIAVIIPVVVVALLLVLGFFLWRKRKARKDAEELRKNEMAEYGFNPNSDPTLVAPIGAAYTDAGSEPAEDNSGYRGWGTTTSNTRKPSTTMGSNSKGPIGMAFSDNGSQPGGYTHVPSPNAASDHYSGEPLMAHPEDADGVAALGGAAAAGGAAATASRNNRNSQADINRGLSNASSSYSHGAPRSESSAEVPYGSPQYHEDAPYNVYTDGPNNGPYGENSYGGDQPIIRDVQARRNTRIERAPTFPQTQGGISQNF